MRKHLLFCLISVACVRNTGRYAEKEATTAPPAPAFLGEASGIYSVQDTTNGDTGIDAVNVVEVSGSLVFRLQSGGRIFAFGGPITAAAAGEQTRHAKATLKVEIDEAGNSVDLYVTIAIGFDSIDMGTSFDPAIDGCAAGVATGKSGEAESQCIHLFKLCDFDARLAGVYKAAVSHVSDADEGDCSQASDVSGARQWALTVANGLEESALVSLSGTDIEYAELLHFDHIQQKFSLSEPLEVGSDFWQIDSALATQLVFAGDNTSLSGTFTRHLKNGCKQTYKAEATRVTGTKPGLSCPPLARDCKPNMNACPVFTGVRVDQYNGGYELRFESGNNDSDPNACPATKCSLLVDARNLCDDASRRIALTGCADDETFAVAPISEQHSDTCLQITCVPQGGCGAGSQGGGFSPDPSDMCMPGERVNISTHSGTCYDVSCTNPAPLCRNDREAPCGLLGGYAAATVRDSDCDHLFCGLREDALPAMFGNDSGVMAAKAIVRGGSYHITGFDPPLSEQNNETPKVTIEPASDGCPPVDFHQTRMVCPSPGDPTPTQCLTAGTNIQNQLGIYRSSQGHLCFGVINLASGQRVSGFQDSSYPAQCNADASSCCKWPVRAFSSLSQLNECLPDFHEVWLTVPGGVTVPSGLAVALNGGADVSIISSSNYSLTNHTPIVKGTNYQALITQNAGGCTLGDNASGVIDEDDVYITLNCP